MSKRSALLVVAAIAIFVLTPLSNWVVDSLFFPWVHADPPLFGRWAGNFTAATGERLDLVLELHRQEWSDESVCTRCSQLEGTATVCDAHGTAKRYDVSGSPKDRKGRDLHLGLNSADSPRPDGLELDTLKGAWDGADTLALTADFVWSSGGSAISSTDDGATDPVPVRLQRQRAANAAGVPEAVCN